MALKSKCYRITPIYLISTSILSATFSKFLKQTQPFVPLKHSNEYLALLTPYSLLCNFFSSQPSVLMWKVKPLKCEKIFWGCFFRALLETKRYLHWASSNHLCYHAGYHFTWVCYHPHSDAIIDWVAIRVELIYCFVLCAVLFKEQKKTLRTRFQKKSSKCRDDWIDVLDVKVHKQGEHNPQHCYISHYHCYISSSVYW